MTESDRPLRPQPPANFEAQLKALPPALRSVAGLFNYFFVYIRMQIGFMTFSLNSPNAVCVSV